MKITTNFNNWTVYVICTMYHDGRYQHIICLEYKGKQVSESRVYNKKKKLDPFIWYENHELYSNTDYHKKMTFSEWEDIITTLSELTKLEYKKKK